jgi:hypothetical protein
MALYNLKSTPDGYRMVKFDNGLDVVSIYNIQHIRGRFYCDCPAGGKSSTCRHREMISEFTRHKAVNSSRFYDFENKAWIKPVIG